MDLRKLGYFLAVVDHGGFTNAADALSASQPAVSLAVKELETEIGTSLFDRVGRQVRLTPAGKALVGPARQALRDVETAKAAVADVIGLRSGSLSICSLPTLAADPLGDLVGRFRKQHPGVTVELAAPESSEEVVELLRSGVSEVGLTEGASIPEDLVEHHLFEQRLMIILPPGAGGAVRRSSRMPVAQLESVALVTPPPGTSSRRLLDEALGAAGVTPRIAVVTAQREAIIPLVVAGAGVALVPEPLADMASRLGCVAAGTRPAITRKVVLARRRGHLAPAAQRFVEIATGMPVPVPAEGV